MKKNSTFFGGWGAVALVAFSVTGGWGAGLGCAQRVQATPAKADPTPATVETPAAAPPVIAITRVYLATAPGWPVWLESDGVRTDQTSGLAFVERDDEGRALFFSCDDVGAFHRLTIDESKKPEGRTTGDGWLGITEITLPEELRANFGTGPAKLDLEEVVFEGRDPRMMDLAGRSFLVSVEGNSSDAEAAIAPRLHESRIGLVGVVLDTELRAATVVGQVVALGWVSAADWPAGWPSGVTRADALPVAGMGRNRGFEGVAGMFTTDRTMVWTAPEEAYADDPLIPETLRGALPLILMTTTEPIVRTTILPPEAGLASVCGMVLAPDGSALYVLDRNLAKIHRCALDADGTITADEIASLDLKGPSGERYFLPSLESITLDDQGHLWAAVDPWKYEPLGAEGEALPPDERARYDALVPMLYKFGEWPLE